MEMITETCHIILKIHEDNGDIYIRVQNNGSQFPEDILEKLESGALTPKGMGIGLLNIHKRIQLIYGSNYGVTLENNDDDYAIAQIKIPGVNKC